MKVKNIKLTSFRSFFDSSFEFKNGKNLIYGDNATGKTTILEAITFLSSCKSPRTNDISDLINKSAFSHTFFISAHILNHKGELSISVGSDGKVKRAQKNGQFVQKISDFIKEFESIYFQPNEVYSFLQTSNFRRSLIDRILFKTNYEFGEILRFYNHTIKEKNHVLNSYFVGAKERELLNVYNSKLANYSAKIFASRLACANELNMLFKNMDLTLDSGEFIQIEYLPFSNDFNSVYNAILEDEIKAKKILIGSHKDDFMLTINNESIKTFGSLGQQKSALLCLKLALMEFYKNHTGEFPVLLIDDAFGELDMNRQNQLINKINKEVQVIITSTSLSELNDSVIENANIIKIENVDKNVEK